MYNVSELYQQDIKKNNREFSWDGVLTDNTGKEYQFQDNDIVSGSSSLTRSCSGSTNIEIGSVYASELSIRIRTEINRYTLYNGTISLNSYFHLSDNSWEKVPMGVYNICEATRTAKDIIITAYDNMVKFDKSFAASIVSGYAYDWIADACNICGVPLNQTKEEIEALNPNAKKRLNIHLTNDINTFRDMLHYVSQLLCAFCFADRDGGLRLKAYGMTPVMTIDPGQRFKSEISDYESYFTHATVEYTDVVDGAQTQIAAKDDTGLQYDIGNNPMMQYPGTAEARNEKLQNIFDALTEIRYTPFDSSVPFNPAVDPGDIVNFTGGQAEDGAVGCITEMTQSINATMQIKCVGENPFFMNTKTKSERDLDTLKGHIDAESDAYYLYHNSDKDIDITNGGDKATIGTFIFVTGGNGAKVVIATMEMQLFVTVATDGSPCSLTFTYFVNDTEIKYHPVHTFNHSAQYTGTLNYWIENVPKNMVNKFKVQVSAKGGSANIPIDNFTICLHGIGLATSSVWDGRIDVDDTFSPFNVVSISNIKESVNVNVFAPTVIPVDERFTPFNTVHISSLSEDIAALSNILVYRPTVNNALVTVTDCEVKNDGWHSKSDNATIVIGRMYNAEKIYGNSSQKATLSFSPDGTTWFGWNNVTQQFEENYEMPLSQVELLTKNELSRFNALLIRIKLPKDEYFYCLNIVGAYVQYTITYKDGVNGEAFSDEVYKTGYGVLTPKYRNGAEPIRTDYTLSKWEPTPATVVTNDATYVAQWIFSKSPLTLTFDATFKGTNYTITRASGEERYEGTVDDTLTAKYNLQRLDTEYNIFVAGEINQTIKTGKEPGDITFNVRPIYYTVVLDTGSAYKFFLENDWYVSGNKGKDSTASVARLDIKRYGDAEKDTTTKYRLTLSCISYGENNYDYGIIYNIDTTPSMDNSDGSNIFKSFKGQSSQNEVTVTIDFTGIDHFIYLKYRKDGSAAAGDDSFKFKVVSIAEIQ